MKHGQKNIKFSDMVEEKRFDSTRCCVGRTIMKNQRHWCKKIPKEDVFRFRSELKQDLLTYVGRNMTRSNRMQTA